MRVEEEHLIEAYVRPAALVYDVGDMVADGCDDSFTVGKVLLFRRCNTDQPAQVRRQGAGHQHQDEQNLG